MSDEEQKDIDPNDPSLKLLKGDEKDLQRLASWIGRIQADSKKKDDMLKEMSQKLESSSGKKPEFGEDDVSKLNEKLHEMILNGNILSAMEIVNNIHTEARKQLKAADKKKFDTAIEAVADDPLMKDAELSAQVRERAAKLMQDGVKADIAVSMAKTEAENSFLKSSGGGTSSLELLGSGSRKAAPAGEKKLPPAAEEAYQKSKKYFKDRQEYIDNLDPRVREQWGLDA